MEKLFDRQPELIRRLSSCNTLITDLDGTINPGLQKLSFVLRDLIPTMQIVPCTTRSWGEMLAKEYSGKETLIKSEFGVFEAGLVIKDNEGLTILCEAEELGKLVKLKELINKSFRIVGPRLPTDWYRLSNIPNDENAFGYLQSIAGNEYVRDRCVPIRITDYSNQYSLVIWPSGSARSAPPERCFYQICFFLDGMKAANPILFKNMDVLVSDESVVIRPRDKNGNSVTKLSGINFLANYNDLDPTTSLFLGDDDNLDLPVAQFIRAAGGVVIVPENSAERIKTIADFVTPGFAGEAMLPVLIALSKIKNGN